MKKLIICSMFSILACAFFPAVSKAADGPHQTEMPNDSTIEKMRMRIDEIHTMDKSTLSWDEKRTLRKEVRSIQKEIYQETGGVYIYVSVGVLLLILIILLILLL